MNATIHSWTELFLFELINSILYNKFKKFKILN